MLRTTPTFAILLAAAGFAVTAGTAVAQQIPAGPAAPAAKGAKPAKGGDAGASGETRTSAEAARKALEGGIKSFEAGKLEPAVQSLTFALRGGGLPAPQMAKALHYRGLAYRKQGKPALAISDLTSALWLKGGLNDGERAAAIEARAGAYREAGLGEAPPMADAATRQAKAAAAPVAVEKPVASATAPVAAPAAAPSSGWQAATTAGRSSRSTDGAAAAAPVLAAAPSADGAPLADAPAPSGAAGGGGLGGFFGNLFGGGASSSEARADTQPTVTASTGPAAATSSWANATAVAPAKGARAAAAPASVAAAPASLAAAAAPAKPAPPAFKGKFRLQVAAVRSRAEADALAKKLKEGHGSAISGREPIVEEAVLGAMGTFYRVRVGPYADANEPRQLCGRIKPDGFDCLVVTQ